MTLVQRIRQVSLALLLALVLLVTPACSSSAPTAQAPLITSFSSQIEQGNTPAGQDFGTWVTQTAQGLVEDAYVRDNDKLGVVISSKVRPEDVRSLATSIKREKT